MNTMAANFNHKKYQPIKTITIKQRHWPDNIINQAPKWCSVDLRDGNQALAQPLSVTQKLTFFQLLLDIGFKEIEVGFPSASQVDYDFVRELINGAYIPDDVTIAILTPAREGFIERSFEALKGAKTAIIHLYNSTSRVQREQVFQLDQQGIIDIAVAAAKKIKQLAKIYDDTQWQFQYSPESFTATELDFAVEICDAVLNIWQPSVQDPVIINLPSTVELSMPNVYADQIEWFCQHVSHREALVISVHTHNDRGTGIAASEMALLAGAQRVEGTLLGNGERTGNMDIITMAMNLYSQGIDPQLDLANIQTISQQVSELIQMAIHPRHPYIGELVYTAFSGSHQDAINKCLKIYQPGDIWEVAYLPIDPADLGRSYEQVIRINSQSGKGGVAYIIEQAFSVQLPRWLQIEFSKMVQVESEKTAGETPTAMLIDLFTTNYLTIKPELQIEHYNAEQNEQGQEMTRFAIMHSAKQLNLHARGVGILDCFISALSEHLGITIDINEYNEQTLQPNSEARAIAFVQLTIAEVHFSGVAQHQDIVMASLNAIVQAVSGYLSQQYVSK